MAHWSEHRERSNHFSLSLLAWSAIHLGRGFLVCLCFPIAFFYWLTAKEARQQSAVFLHKVLPSSSGFIKVLKHFYTFALVSGDRLLFLSGRRREFEIEVHGEEVLKAYAREGQGCLLLVSHLGSFDAMRVPGVEDEQIPVRILIDKQHNQAAIKLIESLNPEMAAGMIDAGRPSTDLVLELEESLGQGDMIGIMADRAQLGERVQSIPFLGEPANFPVGPWLLGAVLKVPIVICFAIYQGKKSYSIHFEQVGSTEKVARRDREQVMANNMSHYVARLEHYTRTSPYNWFNFYNFWHDETTTDN